jgi:predicted GIY-YIG superfamily endonuclease
MFQFACHPERSEGSRFSVRETKRYYVYILTNPSRHPFYTGMTNSIDRRMTEHRDGLNEGYTGRYNLHRLVY